MTSAASGERDRNRGYNLPSSIGDMTLEDKLEELREEWKTNRGTSRTVLEHRAKLIKWAIEKRDKDLSELTKNVKDAIINPS